MSATGAPPKALLFNPPGKILIRGEGRSDSETDPDTSMAAAKWAYPPMNLAFAASYLAPKGYAPVIRDYPAERLGHDALKSDLERLAPVLCVCNLNPSSEREDLAALRLVREARPGCAIVGAAPYLALQELPEVSPELFAHADAMLVAEQPELVADLAAALEPGGTGDLSGIPGILFKDARTGRLVKTPAPPPADFSRMRLPARELLNNALYVRPDNSRPQALIQVGRGCPCQCRFCITPRLTGAAYSMRTVESVLEEIRLCVDRHGIDQFFFRTDTFTLDREWVTRLTRAILDSGLKISWCANSRSNAMDAELARLFKRSGCWLLAFGFESGSPETLRRCGKGITVGQNEAARRACGEQGILVHGQYILGFPWEGRPHMEETLAHVRRMRCDFIDAQILVPYKGTSLYEEIKAEHPELLAARPGSKMSGGVNGTANGLTREDLLAWQKQVWRATYLTPGAVARTLLRIRSPREFANYARYGWKFVTGAFFGSRRGS